MRRHKVKGVALHCIAYLIVAVFLWLAVNAFTASQHIGGEPREHSSFNFYISSSRSQYAEFGSTIDRESRRLSLMVWPLERQYLSRKLIKIQHERINFAPFDGDLWMQLIYLESVAQLNQDERAWSIQRASTLLKWNQVKRSELSHYCITEYDEFKKVSPELCSSLIANLPADWTDVQKARKTNVSVDQLNSVVTQVIAERRASR